MENFVVSARKYRPATFDTVVGQASITTTLKNAIKNNHLAQAFLFCGPRGVGKTTCARILAKTINCFHPTENIEACDQCESCVSFNRGNSLNIYELDAASNNSVDDIRSLIEQVRFAPQLGKFKVYIIDEVHMLSTSAFNAFLKTLEEPPKHAIFILATTERHKILPTILSRCQIFDFSRIKVDDIAKHLGFIASSEGVTAEPEALHVIAQKADGALRDACSIFDQIVSFAGNTVSYKSVIENLNILDHDYYFKVTDALRKSDTAQALLVYNEILTHGFDGHLFINGLSSHFRNLLVCKDAQTLQLLETTEGIKEKYRSQSGEWATQTLIRGLTGLNKADVQYKSSKNQRLLVELTLLQLCMLHATAEAEKKNDSELEVPVVQQLNPVVSSNPVAVNPVAPIGQHNLVQTPVTSVSSSIPKETVTSSIPKEAVQPVVKRQIVSSLPKMTSFMNTTQTSQTTTEVKTEKKEDESEGKIIATAFNQDQLKKAWKDYIKVAREGGKMQLFVTMEAYDPKIIDEKTIEFAVENQTQVEMFETEKTELMGFVRRALNNNQISLRISIIRDDSSRKAYTPQDKFKKMADKNPALLKLRQQFDLDIDF